MVERPWTRMREMATIVSLPETGGKGAGGEGEEGGMGFREVAETLRHGGEEGEKRVRRRLDVKELSGKEMGEVLRRRVDY